MMQLPSTVYSALWNLPSSATSRASSSAVQHSTSGHQGPQRLMYCYAPADAASGSVVGLVAPPPLPANGEMTAAYINASGSNHLRPTLVNCYNHQCHQQNLPFNMVVSNALITPTTTIAHEPLQPFPDHVVNAHSSGIKVKADKPSRVIQLQGIPNDISETEIMQLGLPFGQINNVFLAKKHNQALLEMADISSAQTMVNYYADCPLQIRGHAVYVQFSKHQKLRPDVDIQDIESSSVGHQQQQQQNLSCIDQFKTVLRVIIENVFYPVTLDVLKQIFARYGQVTKIVTFNKNNAFQALIQYSDPAAASAAKLSLDGQNIYQGCCTLRVDFSKLQSLNVRYNNSKSRDYMNSQLPSGVDSNDLPSCGVVYNQGSSFVPSCSPAFVSGLTPAIAYYASESAPGLVTYGNTQLIPVTVQMAHHHQTLVPVPCPVQSSSVLLVTNINNEIAHPDGLFTLFGVYGDVVRVKILFNKKDNALIQFANSKQAQIALLHLDKVKLWGKDMKIVMSKHHMVQLPKENQPDSGLTKDYANSPLHRFKKPNSKNYNNIYPPSATLHLSNIPQTTTEEELIELFSRHGSVVAFKFFESDHKMSLLQMDSTEEAVNALIELHNHQLAETMHLRVSFSKSTLSTLLSAEQQQEEDNNNIY